MAFVMHVVGQGVDFASGHLHGAWGAAWTSPHSPGWVVLPVAPPSPSPLPLHLSLPPLLIFLFFSLFPSSPIDI